MASRHKHAEPRPAPRLYLETPRVEDATTFSALLTAALAAGDVAAVLLRLAEADERTLINRAKELAHVVQDRNVALLLDGHTDLVARAGADGAHLTGLTEFSEAIGQLKPERIAGCGGLETRHDAMAAAEADADYVMFGEPDEAGERPSFSAVEERIVWWAEVFESPCIGFAASASEVAPLVKAGADFIALGDWVWRDPNIVAATIADAARHLVPETAHENTGRSRLLPSRPPSSPRRLSRKPQRKHRRLHRRPFAPFQSSVDLPRRLSARLLFDRLHRSQQTRAVRPKAMTCSANLWARTGVGRDEGKAVQCW
jgi:thiamine-phosphate pyrophosphorylase